MIRKSILFTSILMSLGANANLIDNLPNSPVKINTKLESFNNNENYKKDHKSMDDAKEQLTDFF